MQPEHPIYVVSKGRWELRHTVKFLIATHVPFHLVVEASEAEQYAEMLLVDYEIAPEEVLLVLPPSYKDDYDTFSDVGIEGTTGPGPARNYAWDHAIETGHDWHWVMDDNIRSMYFLANNRKVRAGDGTPFRIMEHFAQQYANLAMCGPQYELFVPRKVKRKPLVMNTRIYSCNLIRNDAPFRWRGRYNEDTDLSIRMLKDGWCTVLFQTILQDKIATQHVKGGNTDEFYHAGTWDKSRMLYQMHPDCTVIKEQFGRWHHRVDYQKAAKTNILVRDPLAGTTPVDWNLNTMDIDQGVAVGPGVRTEVV